MELVVVLIAVAVLGLAALAAAGRFGQMQSSPVRDTYQPPVPEGELRAADIEGVRFGITPMGYDMAQVDELMARVARELDTRDDEQRQLPLTEQSPKRAPEGDGEDLSVWAKSTSPHSPRTSSNSGNCGVPQ
jgi:DivIVA domain-containing protein